MSSPLDPALRTQCREILARGSRSFSVAARLLPARMQDRFGAYYAFCRASDDAIDESDAPADALAELRHRVDRIFAGSPSDDVEDWALAWLVEAHALPRAPVDALLEGYAWDVERRRYRTLEDVCAYGARVAGSVGVATTWLMDRHAPVVLARAEDLGVAMQLTNIARDVGEDARAERLYLPTDWLEAEGIDVERWLLAPRFSPGIGVAVCRLLDAAARLYRRADAGIDALPADCRPAIAGASAIYEAIGERIRARGYDSVGARAVTRRRDKARALVGALVLWHTAAPREPLEPRDVEA